MLLVIFLGQLKIESPFFSCNDNPVLINIFSVIIDTYTYFSIELRVLYKSAYI